MIRRFVLLVLLWVAAVATVSAQISVLGSLTRSRESVSGEVYDGTVSLKNTGQTTAQAKIYLQDYSFNASGETSYPAPGSLPNSNASWITLSAATAVLAPGEVADIKYTVNIPASSSLAGTYWSILFVEAIPEDSEQPADDTPTITIRQVMRYGVQLVTDFAYSGPSDLRFSNTRIVAGTEGRSFSVDLANQGGRWLNGELSLEVYTQDGDFVTALTGQRFRIYPRTSARKAFSLAGIKAGMYKALLVADCGGDDLFGGNYNLVIPE
jgi:hypothetical protein